MLSLILSIVKRELTGAPRRRRFYLHRCALVLLGGTVLLIGFGSTIGSANQTVGLTLFFSLAIASLLGMGLSALTTSLALIRMEKDARTIGLVLVSDVSVGPFILGKLLTALLSGILTLASVLPLFLLSISLGGVSARQILLAGGILLSTLFLGNAMGLFAASATRSEKAAHNLLSGMAVWYFLIIPASLAIWDALKNMGFTPWLIPTLSPLMAMIRAVHGQAMTLGVLNIAVNLILGLILLAFAPRLLRWSVLHEDSAGPVQRLQGSLGARLKKRGWGVPPIGHGNPVAWKDLNFFHGGMRKALWLAIGAALFVFLIVAGFMIFMGISDIAHFTFQHYCQSVAVGISLIFATVCFFGSISHFGRSFQAERKSRALEMLLITPLSDWEIMWGKILAVFKSILPWLAGLAIGFVALLVVFHSDGHYLWRTGVLYPLSSIPAWLAYSAFSMWLSLRTQRNVAVGMCLLVMIGYQWIGTGLFAALLFRGIGLSFLARFVQIPIHLGAAWFFFRLTYRSFRQKALQDVS